MDAFLERIFQKISSKIKEIFYFLNLNFKKHIQMFLIFIISLGALAAILYGVSTIFYPPPEKVTKLFYRCLEEKDFEKAAVYILPEEREKIKNKLEYLKLISESNFKELSFNLIERKKDKATIEVSGIFEVKTLGKLEQGNISEKIQLIRKDGRWYIFGLSSK